MAGEIDPVQTSASTFRIRVAGVLGEEWPERAHGMNVTVRGSEPEGRSTELVGELPDEAALMGVLDALYDHGARLLGVERVVKVERNRERRRRKGATE